MIKLTSQSDRTSLYVVPERIVGLVPIPKGTEVITMSNWHPKVLETPAEIKQALALLQSPQFTAGALLSPEPVEQHQGYPVVCFGNPQVVHTTKEGHLNCVPCSRRDARRYTS